MNCILCTDDFEKLLCIKDRISVFPFEIKSLSDLTTCKADISDDASVIYTLFKSPVACIGNKENSAVIMPFDIVSKEISSLMSGIPLITYGTSSRATIGYSSNCRDGLLISLQRSIKTLSGRTIEPMEINRICNECVSTELSLIETAILLLMQ